MQCFDGAFDETRNPTMSVLTGFLCENEFKLTLAQWRKWKRHTTASGHKHFSLPSSKTAYKKYRVSFVRDVRGGDLHVRAGCLCCQSPEHRHVTWTQTSDQWSSGDASRWRYKHIHTSPAAIDRVMRLTGGHIGAGKLRLLICESLVKQALSIHDTAPDSSISWTKLQ